MIKTNNYRCAELKLIEQCKKINSRAATEEEVLLKHSKPLYDLLKSTKNSTNIEYLEELSSKYANFFIHPVSTF